MLRPLALRSFRGALPSCNAIVARSQLRGASFRTPLNAQACVAKASKRLSLTVQNPYITSLIRHQSTIDKGSQDVMKKGVQPEPKPELVSTTSSVRHITDELVAEETEPDVDMMAGIKSEFVSGVVSLAGHSKANLIILHCIREVSSRPSHSKKSRRKLFTLEWLVFSHILPRPFRQYICHLTLSTPPVLDRA
jgi:hypothetical protein